MANYGSNCLNKLAKAVKVILITLGGTALGVGVNAANKNSLEKELTEVRHKIQTLQNEPLGRIKNREKINQLKARETELEKKLKKS